MSRRPPIPRRLAVPVRVLAWILLILVAIPTLFSGFFALVAFGPGSEQDTNPHNYMAVFSIMGLLVFAPPFLAMLLIVIGLHLNSRAAYVAMIVGGVIGALVLAVGIVDQLSTDSFLSILGMVWMALNLAAAALAFRALRRTRTPQQLPPSPVPMAPPPNYPGGYYGR